jgi:hypothetical protein
LEKSKPVMVTVWRVAREEEVTEDRRNNQEEP